MTIYCTKVVHEVNQQVHVDLIGVHILQHLPSPAAEVVQIRTQVPAWRRVPHYHFLKETEACKFPEIRVSAKITLMITASDKQYNKMIKGWEKANITWCCNVFPPFWVTEMLTSSSSSRILWQYSESFSRTYPVCSTMSSKWNTWEQNHRSLSSSSVSKFKKASVNAKTDAAYLCYPQLKTSNKQKHYCSSHLHWERPPRDGDYWTAVEIVGELVTVHCGAH